MAGVILGVKRRLLGRAAKGGLWENLGPCRSWTCRFSDCREGISVCMCRVLLLLLPLQLGLWRPDMLCFGAGPWRVARETVGQLRRCTQKRGEWVTQAAFSDTAPPLHGVEKGLRDLFLLRQ